MLKIIFVLAMCVVNILVRGVVLVDLWEWFIVPLGVMQIGIAQSLGISLILSFLTMNIFMKLEDKSKDAVVSVFAILIATLVVWGMGAIYASFM